MSLTTLKLGGREYVLLSRREYELLAARAEDRRDGERVKRAMAKFRAGKVKTVSHAAVKRQLGL